MLTLPFFEVALIYVPLDRLVHHVHHWLRDLLQHQMVCLCDVFEDGVIQVDVVGQNGLNVLHIVLQCGVWCTMYPWFFPRWLHDYVHVFCIIFPCKRFERHVVFRW